MLKATDKKDADKGFCSKEYAATNPDKPHYGKHYNVKEYRYEKDRRGRYKEVLVNPDYSFISIKTCPCCKETDGAPIINKEKCGFFGRGYHHSAFDLYLP